MEELLKFLWVVNFLFFALVLVFLWSKVVIISRRLKAIRRLISIGEEIDKEQKRLGDKKKKR
jgi:hypothetical protein